MKKQNVLLILGLALLAPVALTARSDEEAYLKSYKGSVAKPMPVSVVAPYVHSEWMGKVIEVEFVVDADGKPRRIISQSRADNELLRKVIAAVSRWRFDPKLDANGEPVAVRVRLPVHIGPPASQLPLLKSGSWLDF